MCKWSQVCRNKGQADQKSMEILPHGLHSLPSLFHFVSLLLPFILFSLFVPASVKASQASISLRDLGTTLTSNFPFGAYVPFEFELHVDDEIRTLELAGQLGLAVRSCIVYPDYFCADWLPVDTDGKSSTESHGIKSSNGKVRSKTSNEQVSILKSPKEDCDMYITNVSNKNWLIVYGDSNMRITMNKMCETIKCRIYRVTPKQLANGWKTLPLWSDFDIFYDNLRITFRFVHNSGKLDIISNNPGEICALIMKKDKKDKEQKEQFQTYCQAKVSNIHGQDLKRFKGVRPTSILTRGLWVVKNDIGKKKGELFESITSWVKYFMRTNSKHHVFIATLGNLINHDVIKPEHVIMENQMLKSIANTNNIPVIDIYNMTKDFKYNGFHWADNKELRCAWQKNIVNILNKFSETVQTSDLFTDRDDKQYGFVLPNHWNIQQTIHQTKALRGLVRPMSIGLTNVTEEAQFCTAEHRCADLISSLPTVLHVTRNPLCANHPVLAQLTVLRRKRAGRRILSPKSLLSETMGNNISAVMIQPGGTALSLHQLPVSFMYFDHVSAQSGVIRKGGPIPGKICLHVRFGAFASQSVSSCKRSELLDSNNDVPFPWRFLPHELGVSGIAVPHRSAPARGQTGSNNQSDHAMWGFRFGLNSPVSTSTSSPSLHVFGELFVSIELHPDDVRLGTIHSSVETAIMANSWAYNPLFEPTYIPKKRLNDVRSISLNKTRHTYVSFVWGEIYVRAALMLGQGLRQVGSVLEYTVVVVAPDNDGGSPTNRIKENTMAQLQHSPDVDRVIVIPEMPQESAQHHHQKQEQEQAQQQQPSMTNRLNAYSRLLFQGVRGLGVPHTYDTRVFSKLLAFAMVEYDSVAVIDVDVVVVRNLDAALLAVDPSKGILFASVGVGVFSSAFFVLHPDLNTMSELIQVVHECDSWRFPEQDLLNVYFGAGHPLGQQVQQRLPDEFLCMAETVEVQQDQDDATKIETSKCRLIEFASCGLKPWHLNAISPTGDGLCFPENRNTNLWDPGIRLFRKGTYAYMYGA